MPLQQPCKLKCSDACFLRINKQSAALTHRPCRYGESSRRRHQASPDCESGEHFFPFRSVRILQNTAGLSFNEGSAVKLDLSDG